MTYYPIDFFMTDSSPAENPIMGVVLRVYSADGKQFYTETLTDAEGHGGFLLDDSNTYQLRMYKYQVSFTPNPVLFTLASSSNIYDLKGTLFTPPNATDPRLCRASGFFRRGNGAAAANVDIHFIPKFNPLLLEGSAVLTERDITRTDSHGFMQIDLIRCGQYDVTIQGMEDLFRSINVPDAPSINLPDLLFPVVSQITFDPPGPWAVTIGTDLVLIPTIIASDGEVIPRTGPGAVVWGTSDPTTCAVLDNGVSLSLRGFKTGSTTLTATRYDKSIVRYPDLPIVGQPVTIMVQ